LVENDNWGHASDELEDEKKRLSYYNFWKVWDEYNYRYVTNFHPAIPKTWPALQFIKAHLSKNFFNNGGRLICRCQLSVVAEE